MRRYGRLRLPADRFDNYRAITARFDSMGSCGHAIKAGDRIGYNGRVRKTMCPECWRKWEVENAEADRLEANPSACPW
ncbi:MAG: hypothetical protein ABSG86_25350 [Thermoguttaceae bacterium]|jgi:hypothetical protein